jgi:uncharacterized DUF497 family protein
MRKVLAPMIFRIYNKSHGNYLRSRQRRQQYPQARRVSRPREIDWSDVIARPDNRRDYFELREIGYAVIQDRLYCVVFTQRGETMHIISLRKANRREVRDVQES